MTPRPNGRPPPRDTEPCRRCGQEYGFGEMDEQNFCPRCTTCIECGAKLEYDAEEFDQGHDVCYHERIEAGEHPATPPPLDYGPYSEGRTYVREDDLLRAIATSAVRLRDAAWDSQLDFWVEFRSFFESGRAAPDAESAPKDVVELIQIMGYAMEWYTYFVQPRTEGGPEFGS